MISHWNGIGVKDGKVTGIGLGKHFPEALLQGHCNPCCSAPQSFVQALKANLAPFYGHRSWAADCLRRAKFGPIMRHCHRILLNCSSMKQEGRGYLSPYLLHRNRVKTTTSRTLTVRSVSPPRSQPYSPSCILYALAPQPYSRNQVHGLIQ